MPLPRLFAAILGLALPLTLAAATADAAPRHRSAAQVQTATYRVAQQHRAHRPRHASRHHARRVAQARHHSIMRGS